MAEAEKTRTTRRHKSAEKTRRRRDTIAAAFAAKSTGPD